jgi:hypothetical protein
VLIGFSSLAITLFCFCGINWLMMTSVDHGYYASLMDNNLLLFWILAQVVLTVPLFWGRRIPFAILSVSFI